MKKFYKYLLLLAVPCFFACKPQEQPAEPEEPENNTETPAPDQGNGEENTDTLKPGLYIYVDKDVIESDGIDMANFTIKDQDGKVVSTEANVNSRDIFYKNVATGMRLDAFSTGFTSVQDGVYEFSGIYNGKETLNTVTITSQNRAKYEVFHRNVALFKLTATWCPNCPSMTAALDGMDEQTKDHTVILACHNADEYSVQCGSNDLAAAAYLKVVPSGAGFGLPTNVYDLAINSSVRTSNGIAREIMQRRIESPATCGIKVNSVEFVGSDLKVNASMKTSTGGAYDLTCAVLCNTLGESYHNVVIAINEKNFLQYTSSTLQNLSKDEEMTREFTFSFGDNVPSGNALDNIKVAVLAHRKTEDGESVVDNVTLCLYGESVDYKYNE